jgi:FkbH-like protein
LIDRTKNVALSIGVIADFNIENLVRVLSKECAPLGATVSAAPYGQAMQTLLRPSGDFWDHAYDAVMVWTSPAAVVTRFKDVLEFERWSPDDLDAGVDAYVEVIRTLESRAARIFLASWVVPGFDAHRPSIEMKSGVGAAAALLRMNARLAERLDTSTGMLLFNTERWLRQGGPGAFSDKLWYLSKTPYSKAVFDAAAEDIVATLRGMTGLRKKVVILDLDNTLWGGVVGDVGWESLQLGGHDPIGEAYVQFQKELRRLSREGVVLAVASKNEEAVALEAIEKHPEMVLRAGDFAAWQVNWSDKAQNIVELMETLNLGLDSAVFIDDSAHERNRVRQALPDVLVPEWPSDPMDFAKALRDLRCFEGGTFSSEDRSRTTMYVADRTRTALRTEMGSVEEWLETLDLEVQVEDLRASNLERAAQLLNKTNQMNLATRRMSGHELRAWASERNHRTLTFRVRDRIGDYGMCGIASLSVDGSCAELVDFILSCRAMGRGVEEAILSVMATEARRAGAATLRATYLETKKNKPCITWIEQQRGLERIGDAHTFLMDVNADVVSPKHIRIVPA